MKQSTRKRSYSSLLDSVSCATSYGAPSMRRVISHLPHHRLRLTLFIKDKFQKLMKPPGGAFVLFCSCGSAKRPDGCWSAQTHHERSKAELLWPEATLAGNIGTRLP
ncbi:hypothetical protein T08_6985, partial [Trichinella sp. T8]